MSPIPDLVFQFRQDTMDKSIGMLIMEYYGLLESIQEFNRVGDAEKVYVFSQASLPLIEPLIKNHKRKYGLFDVTNIPAFDGIISYCVENELREPLLNLRDIVYYFYELELWRDKVNKALAQIPTNMD